MGSPQLAPCPSADAGSVGRSGQLVYLNEHSVSVHTHVGTELVVHPPRPDTHGRQWELQVVAGGQHLCQLQEQLVPSAIAAIVVRSAGTIELRAVSLASGARLSLILIA